MDSLGTDSECPDKRGSLFQRLFYICKKGSGPHVRGVRIAIDVPYFRDVRKAGLHCIPAITFKV